MLPRVEQCGRDSLGSPRSSGDLQDPFKVTHNTTLAPRVEKPLQVSHGLLLAWTQFLQIKDAMELVRLVYLRFDPCIVPAPRRPRCS